MACNVVSSSHRAQRHSKIGRRHPSSKTRIGQFVPLRFSGIRHINIYFKYYGEKLIIETFGGVDLGVDFLNVISDGGVKPALELLKVEIVSRDLCTWTGVPIFLTIFLPWTSSNFLRVEWSVSTNSPLVYFMVFSVKAKNFQWLSYYTVHNYSL